MLNIIGGQLWIYSLGVGHYIYENYDIKKIRFLASSAGCFAAVPLACGKDPYEWCKNDWGKCMSHFASRGLIGCLFDSKYFYYSLWDEYLPRDEDIHIQCSGKLFISVTLYPSLKNKVVSQFKSRDQLIWTIIASTCLPFVFMRDFPVDCGDGIGLCIDGGFSNDSPCLDSYTITASALHKEADVQCITHKYHHNYHSNVKKHSKYDNEDDIFKHANRIRPIDIVRTPTYERVWQVASMGELSAAQCEDFERDEWVNLLKPDSTRNRPKTRSRTNSSIASVSTSSGLSIVKNRKNRSRSNSGNKIVIHCSDI